MSTQKSVGTHGFVQVLWYWFLCLVLYPLLFFLLLPCLWKRWKFYGCKRERSPLPHEFNCLFRVGRGGTSTVRTSPSTGTESGITSICSLHSNIERLELETVAEDLIFSWNEDVISSTRVWKNIKHGMRSHPYKKKSGICCFKANCVPTSFFFANYLIIIIAIILVLVSQIGEQKDALWWTVICVLKCGPFCRIEKGSWKYSENLAV
jgi:hypothetical protein